jgi:hypothetical protein
MDSLRYQDSNTQHNDIQHKWILGNFSIATRCHYAACHILCINKRNIITLFVVMLNGVMLNVVEHLVKFDQGKLNKRKGLLHLTSTSQKVKFD